MRKNKIKLIFFNKNRLANTSIHFILLDSPILLKIVNVYEHFFPNLNYKVIDR